MVNIADLSTAIGTRVKLPTGYYVEYGGTFEQLQSAVTRLPIQDCLLIKLASEAGVGTARSKRLSRLSFLVPDIVESILDGRHPPALTVPMLNTITNLSLGWTKQRAALELA